ncbi:type II toxin-antitoxin system HicA family toxin [Thioalkalivibrio sp.]|uniref:type II toxin-antitoxin system HicA family toxin n=1 Tax=Thioalkalivibrio sp. TaxID=2093813 RepID=UPI0035624BE4
MGRLGGFRYREVTKRLKKLGFEFDRQAAGSHEIWYNPAMGNAGTPTSLERSAPPR